MTQLRLVLWFPEAVLLSSVFPYVVPFFPFFLFNFLHLPVWVNSPWTDGVISDIRSPDTDCFLSCSYMAGGSCNLRMVRMSGAGARLFFLPCDFLTILSTHTSSVAVRAMTVGHTGLKCRRALVQGCKYVVNFLSLFLALSWMVFLEWIRDFCSLAYHDQVKIKSIQVNSRNNTLIQWQPINTLANQFIGMALCFGLCFHLRTGRPLQKGWAITMPASTAYATPVLCVGPWVPSWIQVNSSQSKSIEQPASH